MKTIVERYLPALLFFIFVVLISQILITWYFVGVFLYDSQYRVLPKDTYLAELITAEDYVKLQDKTLDEVVLSNGTKIGDRQPVWYKVILPNYKKVGDQYLLVTTVGTSSYYPRFTEDILPLLIFLVIGLFLAGWNIRLWSTKR